MIEGENQLTNTDDSNSPTVTETHDQTEKLDNENTDDPVANVTHQIEDVHITVENEASTPVTQETG